MDTQKRMFDAFCSQCNNACQVPFQPKPNSNITCRTCWAKNKESSPNTHESTQNTGMSIKDKSITALSLTRAIASSNQNMTHDMIFDAWQRFTERIKDL